MMFPVCEHAIKVFDELFKLLPEADGCKASLDCFALCYSLNSNVQPQVIMLHGAHTPYRNDTDRELPFRQVRKLRSSPIFYLQKCLPVARSPIFFI